MDSLNSFSLGSAATPSAPPRHQPPAARRGTVGSARRPAKPTPTCALAAAGAHDISRWQRHLPLHRIGRELAAKPDARGSNRPRMILKLPTLKDQSAWNVSRRDPLDYLGKTGEWDNGRTDLQQIEVSSGPLILIVVNQPLDNQRVLDCHNIKVRYNTCIDR